MEHIPVLRNDVQNYLNLKKGETVVDGTLGLGGHALIILEQIGKNGKLIAFEQDERNLDEAKKRLKKYEKQIIYIQDNFRYLKTRLNEKKIEKVEAIFLDLGLSSPHVDDEKRGFSFMKEGPLDMRFDTKGKVTAADVVNSYSEYDLTRIFYEYGEERFSRRIAQKICDERKQRKFETTTELADFISKITPKRGQKMHPATKIFQALRIEVNDELNALKEVLSQGISVLGIGGRFVIISYHSLEDRIVKQFFKRLIRPEASEEERVYQNFGEPIVESLTKKPISSSEVEIEENPRSRSAKLRAYKKLKIYVTTHSR